MSISVVTPKVSAVRGASKNACTCESIKPGSRVLPRPSRVVAPAGALRFLPTATMVPSLSTMSSRSTEWKPSKTRTPERKIVGAVGDFSCAAGNQVVTATKDPSASRRRKARGDDGDGRLEGKGMRMLQLLEVGIGTASG